MKNKIIIIFVLIIFVVLGVIVINSLNNYTATEADYSINIRDDNSILLDVGEKKGIYFKVFNKGDATNYKVGYVGDNVNITYDSEGSDLLEGTINKDEIKYIRLGIENIGSDSTSVTLYSILDNSDEVLPENIKIITEE